MPLVDTDETARTVWAETRLYANSTSSMLLTGLRYRQIRLSRSQWCANAAGTEPPDPENPYRVGAQTPGLHHWIDGAIVPAFTAPKPLRFVPDAKSLSALMPGQPARLRT